MPAIAEALRPILIARYGDRRPRFPSDGHTIAVFPAAHADVGDVELLDDGDEVTLVLGNFTHSHFLCYEKNLPEQARAHRIAADLVEFLDELFADRIELYGQHLGVGGWRPRGGKRGILSRILAGQRVYVWSGPVDVTNEPPNG